MQAGKLRHKIELQSVDRSTLDDYGQSVDTLTTYATVWGSIAPLTGRKVEIAQQVNAEATHEVIIRYRDDVKADDYILFGSRKFAIVSNLNIDERNRTIEILCKEVVE